MHEVSIATKVLRRCRARIGGETHHRIERVRLAVGEFSAVEPDLLHFAWQAITADSPDSGAVLEIEWREATQVCEDCGTRAGRVRPAWHTCCPACGGRLRIEGGCELDVLEFSHSPIPVGSPS